MSFEYDYIYIYIFLWGWWWSFPRDFRFSFSFFFSKKIDRGSNLKFVRLSSIKLSWLKLNISRIRIAELLFLILLGIIFKSYSFRDVLYIIIIGRLMILCEIIYACYFVFLWFCCLICDQCSIGDRIRTNNFYLSKFLFLLLL